MLKSVNFVAQLEHIYHVRPTRSQLIGPTDPIQQTTVRHALLSDQIVAELGGDPLEGDKQGCVGERPIEDW
jgi:hypothetical protein